MISALHALLSTLEFVLHLLDRLQMLLQALLVADAPIHDLLAVSCLQLRLKRASFALYLGATPLVLQFLVTSHSDLVVVLFVIETGSLSHGGCLVLLNILVLFDLGSAAILLSMLWLLLLWFNLLWLY